MNKSTTMVMVAVIGVLLAGAPVLAAPVTNTYDPTYDTDIRSDLGYDLDSEKVLKPSTNASWTRRSLLKFDITDEIPADNIITVAKLKLRLYAASSGDPIDVYRASGTGVTTWGDSVKWADQTSWTYTLAESTVVSLGGIAYHTWDLNLSYVEEGIMTFGLHHKHEYGASGLAEPTFNAKEKWGLANGPKLEITYDVPEPATMTLLLLGLPFALRRRRN